MSGQVPEAALTAIDRQGSFEQIRLLAGGGWSHAIPVATSGPEEAGNICIFCASRASPRLTCHGKATRHADFLSAWRVSMERR